MNYFVHLDTGEVVQVGGVTAVTIVSPLVANGTYRDEPPIVTGGATTQGTGTDPILTVAGGSSQTVTPGAGLDPTIVLAPSSVLQSDSFAHVDLRFKFGPIGMIFFTTENGIYGPPVEADFPMARPITNFKVYEADCFFMLDDVKAVTNCPPPGFTPFTYTPPTP